MSLQPSAELIPGGFAAEAAAFIETLRSDALPTLAVERAVDAVTDTLACMVLGARQSLEAPLRRSLFGGARAETGGQVLGRVLAQEGWADAGAETLGTAALYLGTLAHAADFDDISHPAYCHATALLLPPLLVRAAAAGQGGAALIRAYLVGVETMGQLGRRLNTAHYEAGWHATSTLGTLAATAAIAALDGLTPAQTVTALGIAASLASGVRQNFGSMTKPLHAGLPGRSAILATRLAAEGLTSAAQAVDGRFGFFRTFGGEAEAGHAKPWGGPLEVLTENGLALKAYPCCAATHAAIDAARALAGRHAHQALRHVRVGVSRFAIEPLIYLRPTTPLEAKFCMPYCIAVALHDGNVTLDSFTPEAIQRPQIVALMDRIVMEVDERVADDREFASVLDVSLEGGSTDVERVDVASGKPARWMTASDLAHKFFSCCGQGREHAPTRALFDQARQLAGAASLRPLHTALTESLALAVDAGGGAR
jgi:2-methylcitrate dehydratase PrpD